ncbi:hypothetical protein [Pseudomonas putida]
MNNDRFNPIPTSLCPSPVIHLDTNAPLSDIFNFADQRLNLARHVLASLEGADECDYRLLARAAQVLLEDGCGVMGAIERRVVDGDGPQRRLPCRPDLTVV